MTRRRKDEDGHHEQALSSCRANVEQKLRDAGGASQPLGELLEFGHAQREECLNLLHQRWLESGAPASKKCKFEGSQKEWEEKELREGCPSFGNNLRKFNRARANHWRWALTSVVSRRAFRPRLGASPAFAMLRGFGALQTPAFPPCCCAVRCERQLWQCLSACPRCPTGFPCS